MLREPFWQTVPALGRYKRELTLAVVGALISAACFGAGLGMMLPTLTLLLGQKRELRSLIEQYLAHPHRSAPVRQFGGWLAAHVPADPYRAFLAVMATIAVLSVIGSVGRYLQELMTVTVVLKVQRLWRGRVFRRLIHAPMEQVVQRGSVEGTSRLLVDTGQLATGYQAILSKTLGELLKAAAALLGALYLNWQLTLIGLFGAPIIAVMLRKFGKRIRRASERALQQRSRMLGALKESLGGLAVVKVHNAEGYERRRFSRLNRNLLRQQMRVRSTKALSSPVIDTLALLGVVVVASVAAWQIFRAGVPPEEFMTVLIMLAAAGASLKPLSSLHNDINEASAAAERVLEVLRLPVEPTGADAPAGLPALRRHAREIAVEGVSFRYPGATRDAVRDVDLRVPFGQTVAIVGTNGSGKTTLLSLLVRLFSPTRGRVLIDGVDIVGVDLRSLRSQIAVVTQQTVLFEGTVAGNIAYGRRHAPRERIVAAAAAAYADDFIRALPQGYDTKLGEDGAGLSGGQRQRLSIARAILRDPAILILDEATSQIDTDSEAKITQALRQLRQGRTIFVIAHRLSTVVDADLIVVMSDSRIVDRGRHAELLGRCAIYQMLTQTQLHAPAAGDAGESAA